MVQPTKEDRSCPVRCVLFKDVGGVYTADPKIVPEARLIPVITYEEMLEMASQGAKVIHPRAVEMAMQYGVEIFITGMDSKVGTLICSG